MVLPLSVPLELPWIEIHVAEAAGCIPLRLIVEVARPGMPALPAGGHRFGTYAVSPELDYRDETVAAGPVHPFRAWIRPRCERRERPPPARREWHRGAGSRVAERLHDVPREPLESVDLP